MLVSAESLLMPNSSSSGSNGLVWKKIWKIRVPNKIQHFIWCAAKGFLPMKQNLEARHLPIGEEYDGCGEHKKSIMHCLWFCDQVRSVWMLLLEFRSLIQKKCLTFFELLEELFSSGSNFRAALFANVAWCLWQRRYWMREHQSSWSLLELGDKAQRLVEEF